MLLLSLAQEGGDSFRAYFFQVLDRTDLIGAAVALIEMAESLTGVVFTFETEAYSIGGEQFALALQVRALFVSRAAADAMEDAAFLSGNSVDEGKISGTRGTIHSAGCNQF